MKTHTVIGGGGIKLCVRETGKPDGKPILFIHGFSQCALAWNKQMNSDLAKDFRLIAMDIRGHGLSDKPRDAYGESKLWAEDVQAVLTTLELEKPVLTGWSYAGVILSDYLKHYGEDSIAGTNWVGAASRLGEALVQPGFISAEFVALVPGFFSENFDEGVEALQKLIRLCVYEEPSLDDALFFLGYNVLVPPYVRRGLLSRNVNNESVIERLRKPILLSHGEQDAIVPTKMSNHIARLARQAKLSIYPNVSHAPFWEAPERFNRELREFRNSC